jgi:hypothetical protein
MPTTQVTRRPPPLRFADLSQPMQFWELETQQSAPLNKVDTSKGSYTEAPPAAGLDTTTGQTNQNQEITYIKVSADANTFTLEGNNLPLGPYTLTAQGQVLKIKSDGTDWYKSA